MAEFVAAGPRRSDTGDLSDMICQSGFVPKCLDLWLDRKLLAADPSSLLRVEAVAAASSPHLYRPRRLETACESRRELALLASKRNGQVVFFHASPH